MLGRGSIAAGGWPVRCVRRYHWEGGESHVSILLLCCFFLCDSRASVHAFHVDWRAIVVRRQRHVGGSKRRQAANQRCDGREPHGDGVGGRLDGRTDGDGDGDVGGSRVPRFRCSVLLLLLRCHRVQDTLRSICRLRCGQRSSRCRFLSSARALEACHELSRFGPIGTCQRRGANFDGTAPQAWGFTVAGLGWVLNNGDLIHTRASY